MTYQGETTVELAALEWFSALGYSIAFGPDLAADGAHPERPDYASVVLAGRLRSALARINPHLPESALDDVFRKVVRADSPALVENNRLFHTLLSDGIEIEYQAKDGTTRHDVARLVETRPQHLGRNDWLVVNQFTVIEDGHNRRPDLVVFVNGLPLAVIELKDAANEKATTKSAFKQLQTYKAEIPGLFRFNEILVASDGVTARLGSLTSGLDRFQPWRTIDGKALAPKGMPELQVLIQGVFDKTRVLDLATNFVVFQDDDGKWVKKLAAYHQFHAVNKAVEATVDAASPDGDRRAGVVWHTQGSGKSLTMAFYAGKIIRDPRMENPTLVVLTDRNDLDEQLFDTFASCKALLRQRIVVGDLDAAVDMDVAVDGGRTDHRETLLAGLFGSLPRRKLWVFFGGIGRHRPECIKDITATSPTSMVMVDAGSGSA
jgi:type I restriction enzyme R subunit